MTVVAVADSGPLIHLAELDSLDLFECFESLLVPRQVLEELDAGGRPPGFDTLSCEIVVPDVGEDSWPELDDGERAALTVAADWGVTLLTDDLDARESAVEVGVEVHGSIGVIALGYGRGVVSRSEAEQSMRALQRETSLFVSEAVVERGIEMLDEV